MHAIFNLLYLLLHTAGLAIAWRYYRGTRAFIPGIVTFGLLASAYALQLFVPRDLGDTRTWPGGGLVALLRLSALVGLLGDLCLLGLFFSLSARESGKLKADLWVAEGFAIVAVTCFYLFMFFDPWGAFSVSLLLVSCCYVLLAVVIFRRFADLSLGIATGAGFLLEAVVTAGMWLILLIAEQPPTILVAALRLVGLVVFPMMVAFLVSLAARTSHLPITSATPADRMAKSVRRERVWMIAGVLPLFFWQVYEFQTGGPVAAYLTWAKIPLPIVLMGFCWLGTVGWIGFFLSDSAGGTG